MRYSIGLDIGTNSVGWAALGEDGKLARAKGKNLIGVRLFDDADSASERRSFRTTRRRLSRRRWRLGLLRNLFAPELAKTDQNFLNRLKYSFVNPKDEANQQHYYGGYVFGSSQADHDFYKKYPTIYHLRQALMTDDHQHDLREVYLAIHHIVKYRGNFLNPEKTMSVDNPYDPQTFKDAIENYSRAKGLDIELTDLQQFKNVMLDKHTSKSAKVDKLQDSLFKYNKNDKEIKSSLKAILNGLVGNQINFKQVFYDLTIDKEDEPNWKLYLYSEDFEESANHFLNELDPDQLDLFYAIKKAYDGFRLMSILDDATSISAAMVASYNKHKKNLKLLRRIGRQELTKTEFSDLYTNYLKNDDSKKIKNLITSSDLTHEEQENILSEIDNNVFLPKQRRKANGLLPYQLHLAELSKIFEKQGQYYPFLLDTVQKEDGSTVNKIEELVRFRIPYYVGPMISKADTQGNDDNHWVERKDGQEGKQVTPWNFDQIFDRDGAARAFIERLTGTDTFLIGEDTLPKHSLLYQEFMVLNELNNVRIDGKKLDPRIKRDIYNVLFKDNRSVTKKKLSDYFASYYGKEKIQISGLADETKFNSNLSTYYDLSKVFDRTFLDDANNAQLLAKIVEIQTVFEDKNITVRELNKLPELSQKQVQKLSQTHYTGWGNLSNKLLTTPIIVSKNGEKASIMDKLRTTRKNFQQVITNVDYGVQDWIKKQNLAQTGQSLQEKIDELTTSPANKRGIKQAFNVINDIVKATGSEPDRIYLEFARETQNSVRTKTRKNRIEESYKKIEQTPAIKELRNELKELNLERFADEKVYLYFLQEGKDMYTGQPIDFSQLSQQYDVDHIIPQAFKKDDSIDNKVLVNRPDNARKSDSPAFTQEIQQGKAGVLWKHLLAGQLISRKKYENLTRTGDFDEGLKQGFINRQLVETRQIIKNVATLIEGEYEETKAVAIRSEITTDMRKLVEIKKHRDINDYHHAFDALLITAAGEYIKKHFDKQDDQFVYNAFNRYTKDWLDSYRENNHSSEVRRLKPFGFVVGSMSKGNDDWSDENTKYIRHVMAYKNILATRRLGKDRGQLYKETINPADPKRPLVSVNANRKDTRIYGGFTQVNAAYMSLVRVSGKNRLVKITMSEASQINQGLKTIEQVISGKKKSAAILIPRVDLGQLIRDENGPVLLASNEYQHNAKELWLSSDDADIVSALSEEMSEEEFMKIFDILTSDDVIRRFPLYKKDLIYTRENRETVEKSKNKYTGLKAMLQSLQLDASEKKPLKKFDSSLKEWHRLQSGSGELGITLSDNAEIIYQSPTGLFENRVKIADLL